jgi:hypothetical protein
MKNAIIYGIIWYYMTVDNKANTEITKELRSIKDLMNKTDEKI